MAAAPQPSGGHKLSLEIRTKSVEQTLIPLVTQITTLVNHKEKPKKSEKTIRALVRVGQAVNLAVERFVCVGESIAEENPEISHDMCEACKEARNAGAAIQKLTDIKLEELNTSSKVGEKTAMVRAARQLLSAITKVLLLADRVVVKQLLAAKNRVSTSLMKIESVNNFTDFVKAFSQFGGEMVELAHLTGDRQNDLKSEKHRAQMGVARAILEKSTMMLLTTSKTYLRHPECQAARSNRDNVFSQMRRSMDTIHHVVTDGTQLDDTSPTMTANGDSGISLAQHQPTAARASKDFDDLVETTRVTLVGPNTEGKLQNALETMIETAQDFTDSAYTSHENRERILILCERVRQELTILLRIGANLDAKDQNQSPNRELETAIIKTKDASKVLRKQLQDTAMEQCSDIFKANEDADLLQTLRSAGQSGERNRVDEISVKFQEHAEQLQEACKLLRHIAQTEQLMVWTEHAETSIKGLSPQIIYAAQALSNYPTSKIAKENFDVFADSWSQQINDLSILVKDINDICQGKQGTKQVYLSLPRPGYMHGQHPVVRSRSFHSNQHLPPHMSSRMTCRRSASFSGIQSSHLDAGVGAMSSVDGVQSVVYSSEHAKHGTTAKMIKPVKLSAEEQAKIAKLGLEMKLITSEMDAETEKWDNQSDNEIVRRAKNMSSMAFSMYLFTRGEGPLKTTQDLFTQAEYFAEEGVKLFKAVKDFTHNVPTGTHRTDLVTHLERLPILCQQLNFTLKSPTVGKSATFNKVDTVIQQTKDLMNCVAKVVTTCFICATKYNIDYRGTPGHKWRPVTSLGAVGDPSGSREGSDGTGSDRDSVKSGRSARSESLMRTASLGKQTPAFHNYDRL